MIRRSMGVMVDENNFDKAGFTVENNTNAGNSFLKGILLNKESLDIMEQAVEQLSDVNVDDK